jgi:hypothetical protein
LRIEWLRTKRLKAERSHHVGEGLFSEL